MASPAPVAVEARIERSARSPKKIPSATKRREATGILEAITGIVETTRAASATELAKNSNSGAPIVARPP
ncbi:MAG TPA: hypothetical protein VI980_04220 [Acidimicrobiia bacterium]|nr:hypothetical protein [Acidimicrobiia bacterium]